MDEKKSEKTRNEDPELLERTNPVFNTAKITLCELATLGNPDAVAVAEEMKLPWKETQRNRALNIRPEQDLAVKTVVETRYRTIGLLAEHSGCPILVDLPCGYTQRAVEFSGKGIRYIGMDLPAVISEMNDIIPPMIGKEKRGHVRFAAVDATNYDSLKNALEGEEGEICITTEGLLLYLSETEIQAFLNNIKKLLEEHGGCWLTADPEVDPQHMRILKAITGDRFEERRPGVFQKEADVKAMDNALSIRYGHEAEDTQRAMVQLAEYGLRAERMIIADHMPELAAFSLVTTDQKNAILKAMKEVAYWKVTSAAAPSAAEAAEDGDERFRMRSVLKDGMLHITLSGRLDTLTAPQLLELYESKAGDSDIRKVLINCEELKYISSAGLRVLLIIHKECSEGVALSGVNHMIEEILVQSGFSSVFACGRTAKDGADQ